MAYSGAMNAGTKLGRSVEVRQRFAEVLRKGGVGAEFVRRMLGAVAGKE